MVDYFRHQPLDVAAPRCFQNLYPFLLSIPRSVSKPFTNLSFDSNNQFPFLSDIASVHAVPGQHMAVDAADSNRVRVQRKISFDSARPCEQLSVWNVYRQLREGPNRLEAGGTDVLALGLHGEPHERVHQPAVPAGRGRGHAQTQLEPASD